MFVDPIRSMLSTTEHRLTAAQKGQLRAVYIDSLWTQSRLFENGLVSSPDCKLCGREPGTLRHRHWRCDGTASRRYIAGMREVSMVAGASNSEDPLWSNLWAVDPCEEAKLALAHTFNHVQWHGRPSDGVFTGEVYIDGSVFDPEVPQLSRAGYAVVQLADAQGGAPSGPRSPWV
jgi:hypothetical protein